jgi:hypothetical protein
MAAPLSTLPVVGANGDIYVAAEGTAIPGDWTDLDSAPWTKIGLISEDGLGVEPKTTIQGIKAWQSLYDVRRIKTKIEATMKFAIMEWTKENIIFAFGGGSWAPGQGVGNDMNIYTPPTPDEQAIWAISAKVLDGPLKLGLYFPQVTVDEIAEVKFKREEAALLEVTTGVLGSATMPPWQMFSDDARFD